MSMKKVLDKNLETERLDYAATRALGERCVKRGWVKRPALKNVGGRIPKTAGESEAACRDWLREVAA